MSKVCCGEANTWGNDHCQKPPGHDGYHAGHRDVWDRRVSTPADLYPILARIAVALERQAMAQEYHTPGRSQGFLCDVHYDGKRTRDKCNTPGCPLGTAFSAPTEAPQALCESLVGCTLPAVQGKVFCAVHAGQQGACIEPGPGGVLCLRDKGHLGDHDHKGLRWRPHPEVCMANGPGEEECRKPYGHDGLHRWEEVNLCKDPDCDLGARYDSIYCFDHSCDVYTHDVPTAHNVRCDRHRDHDGDHRNLFHKERWAPKAPDAPPPEVVPEGEQCQYCTARRTAGSIYCDAHRCDSYSDFDDDGHRCQGEKGHAGDHACSIHWTD